MKIFPLLAKSILLIGFCGAAWVLQAQKNTEQYDALLNEAFAKEGPGATALVAKEGKILYKKAFGKANLELDVDMTPDMVFEIGSITKQFTAVSILMLMEQGKLSLEDDITKFVKDYPSHGHKISIHHLLTHTSGIKSYTALPDMVDFARKDHTPAELIDRFKYKPMDFAPGEKWNYNNSAYFLLGHIIEEISGMSYAEYLQKNIFTPLGMSNSYFGSMSQVIKNRAYGYQKDKDAFVNADYLSLTIPYAAGSIMSTVEDLHTWQRALQAGKLIKKETLQLAHSNYKLNNGKLINYGYGWSIDEIFGSPAIEHSGGIFGFLANGIYMPEEDVYVAVLSNCNCNSPIEVSTRMAALAIGKPYPTKKSAVELKEALKNLVGMYEFEDGTKRNIIFENGQLYSERRGNRLEIYPRSKENFFFNDNTASYTFSYNSKGEPMSVAFHNRINHTTGKRVSKEIVEQETATVSEEVFKQFVGTYEIRKGFEVVITVEEGKLIAQATGQQKFQLHATSTYKYFIKEVEAEVEFKKAENGEIESLVLYQGGQEVPAKRTR